MRRAPSRGRHLKPITIAIAHERHFRRVAEACGVTQPTLSAGIKQLEDTLGVMLVRRGSRFLGFTSEGERVLEWARRIVANTRVLRQDVEALKRGLTGLLRLAAIPTAAGPLVSFARSGLNVRWDPAFQSLLEVAEACDIPVRWSCRTGVCHSCETGLVAGSVAYRPAPLDPLAAGNALTAAPGHRATSLSIFDKVRSRQSPGDGRPLLLVWISPPLPGRAVESLRRALLPENTELLESGRN